MGQSFGAICNQCGTKFMVDAGGGSAFHVLHCETCGQAKSISFEELGDLHAAYLKGLGGPYAHSTRKSDKFISKNFAGEPISEEEYDQKVEEHTGLCGCGGHFRFSASARCPKCRNNDWTEDPYSKHVRYE
jgi:Zn ribbon nucleic-acid-binding protein